jgi:hypothetical protein
MSALAHPLRTTPANPAKAAYHSALAHPESGIDILGTLAEA